MCIVSGGRTNCKSLLKEPYGNLLTSVVVSKIYTHVTKSLNGVNTVWGITPN